MFLHQLKYNLLNQLRQKETIFWMICFPVILATFFKLAFGGIYEKDEMFREIPVAVVTADSESAEYEALKEVLGGIELFKPEFLSEDEALEKLEEGSVSGIIVAEEKLSMKASNSGITQTIIKTFAEQYNSQKQLITDTAINHPEKLNDLLSALAAETNAVNVKETTSANMDEFVQYFFNLIAMVALFAAQNGITAATSNQGNLSPIGARKCASPAGRFSMILSGILSTYIIQAICTCISITFVMFILKVDMGNRYGMIYLSGILSPLLGTTLGFFIGSIGRASEGVKTGITMAAVMFCCFLSGLMVGNMKSLIEENIPIINRINPAALISDLFYCLMIYDGYERYIRTAVTMLILTAAFTAGGFLLTRRKKYASL